MDKGLDLNSPKWWDSHAKIWKKRDLDRDRPEEYKEVVRKITGGPVLEIGPGFGALCKHLPRNIDYVGMDISEAMIIECRVRHPRRLFTVGNILEIKTSLYTKAFEHSIALQTLEHFRWEDLRTVLGILKKITRKSLLFSVPRGLPSEATRKSDGHLIGWVDEEAIRVDFEEFGKVTFMVADKNHIGGELHFE